jgi:hypothetical protein
LPFEPAGTTPVKSTMAEPPMSLAAAVLLAMVNEPFEEVFLPAEPTDGLRRFGNSIALGAPLLVRIACHL